jgi:hypothetical protein
MPHELNRFFCDAARFGDVPTSLIRTIDADKVYCERARPSCRESNERTIIKLCVRERVPLKVRSFLDFAAPRLRAAMAAERLNLGREAR